MDKKYKRTFEFFDTEDEAKEFCKDRNINHHAGSENMATWTPWENKDRTEQKFVVWYSTK